MQSVPHTTSSTQPGRFREVLRLAVPLIISNSFWTLQLTIDRMMLSTYDGEAVGAALAANVLYWTFFGILFAAAGYTTTFVAQYVGANRLQRVGPVVWQSLYFALIAGIGSLLLLPISGWLIALGGHSPQLQEQERVYFRWLCFAALPMLITASATCFYLGRGKNWPVLLVNGLGMLVNGVLDYAMIFGTWGFPEWGIYGAGLATVIGSWAAAILALVLFLLPRFTAEYGTWTGWRFEFALFQRLMRFGLPAGLQWSLEGLAITIVILLIGRLGAAEQSATSIAFTINMFVFLPIMGIAQAVSILVGQHLGEDRPDLAERATWSGFTLAWVAMAVAGLTFVLLPDFYLGLFKTQRDDAVWPQVAEIAPVLLRFVALYCLFDSLNLVFSFALKGAGDIRFVTVASLGLSWPLMVVPSYFAWMNGLGVYWIWVFISLYVVSLGIIFLWRFLQGKWKSMRVIEPAVVPEATCPLSVDGCTKPAPEPAAAG